MELWLRLELEILGPLDGAAYASLFACSAVRRPVAGGYSDRFAALTLFGLHPNDSPRRPMGRLNLPLSNSCTQNRSESCSMLIHPLLYSIWLVAGLGKSYRPRLRVPPTLSHML